ncbi:MAG: hypothetical protein SWH68_15740, partial [Thermodesulfobacteriota bacterium]|nr:hypothetical protein [Thermodesulfobacteriota bacterium]
LARVMVLLPVSLFQSTLPRGERPAIEHQRSAAIQFQSTLPRGERPLLCVSSAKRSSFNPRSRGGSDRYFLIPQFHNKYYTKTAKPDVFGLHFLVVKEQFYQSIDIIKYIQIANPPEIP